MQRYLTVLRMFCDYRNSGNTEQANHNFPDFSPNFLDFSPNFLDFSPNFLDFPLTNVKFPDFPGLPGGWPMSGFCQSEKTMTRPEESPAALSATYRRRVLQSTQIRQARLRP